MKGFLHTPLAERRRPCTDIDEQTVTYTATGTVHFGSTVINTVTGCVCVHIICK